MTTMTRPAPAADARALTDGRAGDPARWDWPARAVVSRQPSGRWTAELGGYRYTAADPAAVHEMAWAAAANPAATTTAGAARTVARRGVTCETPATGRMVL